MEAALLRLNPQLDKIKRADPKERRSWCRTVSPSRLTNRDAGASSGRASCCTGGEGGGEFAAAIKERTDEFAAQSAQVQTWLKGDQAKELVKESPELKEIFTSAAAAAKAAPKKSRSRR